MWRVRSSISWMQLPGGSSDDRRLFALGGTLTDDRQLTIPQRLQRLESIEAIKQLKYRYLRACDRQDPAGVKDCYAEGEIELDFGRVGTFGSRDELVEAFSNLACHPHIVEMHHAHNPEIVIEDENNASGCWGLYYFLINTRDNATTQLGGYYEDLYRRTAEGWRICASRFTVTSTLLTSVEEGQQQLMFMGSQASLDVNDPSSQA